MSSTIFVIFNLDGTITRGAGSGFTYDGSNNPTGGTITSLFRMDGNGVSYEGITGLSLSLVSFRTNIAVDIGGAMSGADTVLGSIQSEILYGYGGGDSITGGGFTLDANGNGGDLFVGGAGNDTLNATGQENDVTVVYGLENGGGGITVNLAAGTATDTFGNTDTLIGIRNVSGTAQNDSFIGGATDDSFQPGRGNDTIDGGAGFDQIDYSSGAFFNLNLINLTGGITVNQSGDNAGTVTSTVGSDVGTDTFTNVERVRGTQFADIFNGSAFNDSFRGLAGNDTFNGGNGFDDVDYRSDVSRGGLAGINVTYTGVGTATVIDGFGNTDSLNSIEWIRGTQNNDLFNGGAGGEQLQSEGGNDTLNGGGGDDTLRPGAGNDVIDGGAGTDLLDYRSDPGTQGMTVTYSGVGAGTVIDGFGNTDTFSNIEFVLTSNFADSIIGSTGDDRFAPGRGNDTVNGNGGNDVLFYNNEDTATSGITANLSTGIVTSAYYGTDTIQGTSIRQIFGTQFGDSLTGSARDETFGASLGTDTIDGGSGFDRLSYQDFRTGDSGLGVTFSVGGVLNSGTVLDTGGSTDTYINIESLRGSRNADTFIGGTTASQFEGLQGNDTFTGGAGVETVSYQSDIFNGGSFGVYVALGSNVAIDGFGNVDSLTGIDIVLGTNSTYNGLPTWSDFLIGGSAGDTFLAFGGNDYLDMGAGIDVGYGGDGDDYLFGRDGGDYLYGEAGVDYMTGDDGADVLVGGAGNDYLFGGAGNDTIYGDADSDFFIAGAGSDVVYGGAGQDFFYNLATADYVAGDLDVFADLGADDYIFMPASMRGVTGFVDSAQGAYIYMSVAGGTWYGLVSGQSAAFAQAHVIFA